jgi:hypothetical protein
MKRDLIISMMALRQVPPDAAFATVPILIEWPGRVPAGGGHPGWGALADSLRAPPWRKGELLPALLKRYERFIGSEIGRIAVVGFSAGANSGVRELLRNETDRSRIDFVASVDGMHPNFAPRPLGNVTDPRSNYADWSSEMGGLESFARRAASGGVGLVCTASDIPSPSPRVSSSSFALESLTLVSSPPQSAPDVPARWPLAVTSPLLKPGESYPKPTRTMGARDFVAFWYPKIGTSLNELKRTHILQAQIVAPDIVKSFLVARWNPSAVLPASFVPTSELEPFEPSPAKVSGIGAWAVPAGFALAGVAVSALL